MHVIAFKCRSAEILSVPSILWTGQTSAIGLQLQMKPDRHIGFNPRIYIQFSVRRHLFRYMVIWYSISPLQFNLFTESVFTLQESTCPGKADQPGIERCAGDIASGETPEIGLHRSTLHMSPPPITALIHRDLRLVLVAEMSAEWRSMSSQGYVSFICWCISGYVINTSIIT